MWHSLGALKIRTETIHLARTCAEVRVSSSSHFGTPPESAAKALGVNSGSEGFFRLMD